MFFRTKFNKFIDPILQTIEIGDLTLSKGTGTRQTRLFTAIQQKIVYGLWQKEGKLPSTRKLAQELSLSRNTVIAVYEQLVAEGYLESRLGSGFYVAVELPEHYLTLQNTQRAESISIYDTDHNRPFAPGVPDLAQFPYAKWQKLVQKHISRPSLSGNQNLQGSKPLRMAVTGYLASSRSVNCTPERIIITNGAQQALSIALMATLTADDTILMEQPGYVQMRKIIKLLNIRCRSILVDIQSGLDLTTILESHAQALYITPSNQYPMGTTISTDDRLKLIGWATAGNRWIIEDDYDSEFQFAHRPYTSLQGLAGQLGQDQHVMYIGSFSKIMFNGLRIGYLVVPEFLVPRCLEIKDALSGDLPSHTQAALADFIIDGDLSRHIRKMRRLYKEKYQRMLNAINQYFSQNIEVISQPAGLHVTLKWQDGIDELTWSEKAKQHGIILRPLSYYEQDHFTQRTWSGAVLGFGNIRQDDIDSKIHELAQLFFASSV